MTTRSSSTLDASSGIVSGKTLSLGDDTQDTSSSCFCISDMDVLGGESTPPCCGYSGSDCFPACYRKRYICTYENLN